MAPLVAHVPCRYGFHSISCDLWRMLPIEIAIIAQAKAFTRIDCSKRWGDGKLILFS